MFKCISRLSKIVYEITTFILYEKFWFTRVAGTLECHFVVGSLVAVEFDPQRVKSCLSNIFVCGKMDD